MQSSATRWGVLAAVWACSKFSRYLYGLDSFTLPVSDHKPLIPLINCKDLDSVPMMCQTFLLHMMRYKTTAMYLTPIVTQEKEADEEAVQESRPISPTELNMVIQQTLQDTELQIHHKYAEICCYGAWQGESLLHFKTSPHSIRWTGVV